MINKVTLVGNLGRDPELRRFDSGGVVAKFTLATNENYKDRNGQWQTQTEWHDIVCWGPLAERAERIFRKGKLVYIEGKITHRKYTDQNNVERYITEIVANTARLLERPEQGEGSQFQSQSQSQSPTSFGQGDTGPVPPPANAGGMQDEEGDLPF